ncbi:MAG: hypothetical protein WCI60_02410 [bacterium]
MDENLKNETDLNWCVDIFRRIESVINDKVVESLDDKPYENLYKLAAIKYLVKQGLKVVREE